MQGMGVHIEGVLQRREALGRSLLRVSQELLRATRIVELLGLLRDELEQELGLRSVWMYVIRDLGGRRVADLWTYGEVSSFEPPPAQLEVEGDLMLEEIFAADEPVIVEDARVDPRTDKRIVAQLGNRTIVNVPVVLAGGRRASLGTGTFGDEGSRTFDEVEVEYLTVMARLAGVGVDRLRIFAEREELAGRLAQAQKLEAIGRLAGGGAHDFNNLLTAVLGNAIIIARLSAPDDPRRDAATEIQAVAESAGRLTHQLLTFARRQPVDFAPLDVNELVESFGVVLRRVVGPAVTFRAVLCELPCPVEADRAQLEQVLLNLAVNARDAMPRGGTLEVATFHRRGAQELGGRDAVGVAVRDSGVGMDEAQRARAFEPFFTTKSERGGTGLGLATCHGVVARAGGSIGIESAPGAGTTVEVLLPLGAVTPVPGGELSSSRGGEAVLVVEDEPRVAELVTQTLREHGYHVTLATSGEEAARLVGADLDLLVTDVVLPRSRGTAVAEALRRAFPRLRVLYTSGYAPDLLDRALLPWERFLRKPFSTLALLRAVREALDRPGT